MIRKNGCAAAGPALEYYYDSLSGSNKKLLDMQLARFKEIEKYNFTEDMRNWLVKDAVKTVKTLFKQFCGVDYEKEDWEEFAEVKKLNSKIIKS